MNATQIGDNYFVAAQILPHDVTAFADAGFVAIICNRPDNEDPGQPSAAEIAAACEQASVDFHHIPMSAIPLTRDAVLQQRRIVEESAGPVLGYCRSGHRSTVIFEMSA